MVEEGHQVKHDGRLIQRSTETGKAIVDGGDFDIQLFDLSLEACDLLTLFAVGA